MSFKPVKLSSGRFAVQKGRVKKDGHITYLKSTKCDTLKEAEQFAAYHTALDAIDKAHKLINDVTLLQAKEIASDAYDISDSVVNRCEQEDPDFDHYDPKGFLA